MDYFNPESEGIKPNSMQRRALKELRRNRDLGVKKSLCISATGSGLPTPHLDNQKNGLIITFF